MTLRRLYSSELIHERIATLGAQISIDYADKNPLLVGVLKGCTVFMGHLLVQITCDVEMDFVTLRSYGAGTESRELELLKDLDRSVEGRHLLIVEDIIDTGKTVAFLKKHLQEKGAASVEVVTFVDKELRRKENVLKPAYVGFNYSEGPFLVGFGFDLNERYRNLPEVYQWLNDDASDE